MIAERALFWSSPKCPGERSDSRQTEGEKLGWPSMALFQVLVQRLVIEFRRGSSFRCSWRRGRNGEILDEVDKLAVGAERADRGVLEEDLRLDSACSPAEQVGHHSFPYLVQSMRCRLQFEGDTQAMEPFRKSTARDAPVILVDKQRRMLSPLSRMSG